MDDSSFDPAHHPVPTPPRRRALLFGSAQTGWRWPVAARSALTFGLPALIVLATGHQQQASIVALGAFSVLYGETRAYRMRWRVVLLAGVGFLTAAALGAVIGARESELGQAGAGIIGVAALSVVALVTSYVMVATRAGPPGMFFFVLVCAVATRMAAAGVSVPIIVGYTALGVLSSVLVSMTPMLRDARAPEKTAVAMALRAVETYVECRRAGKPSAAQRHAAGAALHSAWATVHDAGLPVREPDSEIVRTLLAAHRQFIGISDAAPDILDAPVPMTRPTVGQRLSRSLTIRSHAATTALRTLAAAVIAGGISVLLGLGRPDWAVITAVLVLNLGPDRIVGTVRAAHRVGGTVIGLMIFAVLHALAPSGLVLILLLMALMFLTDLFVVRNYGIAVVFITPLALLIGGALGGPILVPVRDRLIETSVGALVAVAAMWVIVPRAHRHDLRWNESRVLRVAADLVETLRTKPPGEPATMRLRRDLQFELVGNHLSGVAAYRDEPAWTRAQWPRHAEIGRIGYDLLAQCWLTPTKQLIADPDDLARQIIRMTAPR
ncbi:FUSC family protein [Nocardia sp. NPDC052112]|uniref:FUSC family protein n=1 Tax=Nocardia sp. NPDC052112 TaxID=3155646 RepID=UPI00343E08A9